ncbi:YdcF family protein [uncultured Piscinibacter sp.]|uniref:YdcF family protein n=1 Tax=uncultured Piscinibacter sp. TaxID=1131835 RepID=UPI0026355014|nr:YdcF family protein [uncultured Piscinibacter sp.]
MNDLFVLLGLSSWKPFLGALLLPPLPFIAMMLVGTRLASSRRKLGWAVVLAGAAMLWASSTTGMARVLSEWLLRPPGALGAERIAAWKAAAKTGEPVAIVVLGGGAKGLAPEYGLSSLTDRSMERLRYGLWLARETGAPAAFSGGIGWAQARELSTPEAQIAARIAAQEFRQPLKWIEDRSHDTRENAAYSVNLLRAQDIRRVLLVTHQRHMPRAMRAFEEAAAGSGITFEAAPVDVLGPVRSLRNWMPSTSGIVVTREIMHEWLGLLFGA